jgi:fermentation-respiration switch protein FrsA (DUF1100 family)
LDRLDFLTTTSAVLIFPPGFDESKKYPAIVVTHPVAA